MSTLELVSSTSDLDNYLTFLYGESVGYSYVPTREVELGAWTQQFFAWPNQKKELVDFIVSNSGERNVYISPALFKNSASLKGDFQESNVVWAEIDRPDKPILGNVPEPSYRISSGGEGHEHWYWKLTEPITEYKQLEAINRSLTYELGADVSGWDCNQVLRPPDTFNHKRARATGLLARGTTQYSPTYFSSLKPGPVLAQEINLSIIPDVAGVILKYAFTESAIETFRSSPQHGTRSIALMSLGHQCAEMGMTDEEIFTVVRNADDRWKKFVGRDDRNQRLSDLVAVARAKHPTFVSVSDSPSLDVIGYEDFMASEIHLEWLIPGVLQRGGYMLCTGPSGVGKTQWALQWAIHLALGKDFMGATISAPEKIVFFSLEMGHADLKFFLSNMANDITEEESKILQENLLLIPLGEALYMDTAKGQKLVEDVVKEVRPAGIFIDSLGSSTTGELGEATVKSIMDFNDRLRQRFGIFTWFIHHNRKAQSDNRKPNKQSDIYGGQYIANRATSIFCLWPEKEEIEIIEIKVRLKAKGNPYRIRRTSSLNFIRVSANSLTTGATQNLEYKRPLELDGKLVEEDSDGFMHDVKEKPNLGPLGDSM